MDGSYPVGDYSGERFLFDNEKNHQTGRCDKNRKCNMWGVGRDRLRKTRL